MCEHPDDYRSNLGGNTYDCPPVWWCGLCGAVEEYDPKRGWAIPENMIMLRQALKTLWKECGSPTNWAPDGIDIDAALKL